MCLTLDFMPTTECKIDFCICLYYLKLEVKSFFFKRNQVLKTNQIYLANSSLLAQLTLL